MHFILKKYIIYYNWFVDDTEQITVTVYGKHKHSTECADI